MASEPLEMPSKIGPYRITARLGAGGMGEVYQAWDERLDRAVAIKVVRGRRRGDDSAHERFRREARIVARLKHPAIPPIYDVLTWKDGDCLVMELVEGETLAKVLWDGPLQLSRALKLFRQIAGGLAAAHAKGIVHRDLKSSNVMVTPEGDAKVLDFGLAKSLALSESPLSVEGGLLGTFYCMSPEQAQGLEIDHRSDLFSLGALMYESLTGVAPFRGANVQETLAQVCMHRQKPAHLLDAAIPEELSRLVDRLLQKEPAERPLSADEVRASLNRIAASSASGTPHPTADSTYDSAATVLSEIVSPLVSGPWKRRVLGLVAIAGLVLLVFVITKLGIGPLTEPAARSRPAVAVLGLEERSPGGGSEWLSTALSEVLAGQLAAGASLRVVAGERVSRLRHDLGWAGLATHPDELRERLHQHFGVSCFVAGEFRIAAEDGLLTAKLRLHDVHSGALLAEAEATGSRRHLSQLLAAAADRFRRELGAGELSPARAVEAGVLLPADPRAMEGYARGLEELRRSRPGEATRWLTEAAEAEPDHPVLLATLAESYAALGEAQGARLHATRAMELLADPSASFPEGPGKELEARLSRVLQDRDREIEVLEPLFRSAPEDLDFGLRLAEAHVAMARIPEALAVLDDLGRLPRPLSRDPRIDLVRAAALEGSPLEVLRWSRAARERAGEIGARSLVARALLVEAGALQDQGDYPAAARTLDQARRSFDELEDRTGLARTLESQANSASLQGQLEVASNLLSRAGGIYREIGSRRDQARLLVNTGNLHAERGRLGEADALYDEALAIYEEIGDDGARAVTLVNLGASFHEAAELARALERYQQAFDLFAQLEHERGKAAVLTNIGEVHLLRGMLDRARELHEEARAINIAGGEEPGRLYDTFRLGDVAAARGDHFVARRLFVEALAGMEEMQDFFTAADVRAALAEVELHDGDFEAAETYAAQAEEVARTQDAPDLQARALLVLGRSRLARRRIPEAQATLEDAGRLLESGAYPRLSFQAATLRARVQAASGRRQDVDAALAALQQVIEGTAERGLVPDHLEARLARAEIRLAAGLPGAGDELEMLIREASDGGFGSIVERAEKL